MRCILTVLLLMSFMAPAQAAPHQGIRIHDIEITGFVLGDKDQFVKLFKPLRDKYLTKNDMDNLLQKIENIYQMDGYQELVSITYQVEKRNLTYTVALIQ